MRVSKSSVGIRSFRVIRPHRVVKEILDHIEKYLPHFTASDEFVDITDIKKNENQHSAALSVYLTNFSSKFYFLRESSQKGSSTIDIGVYYGSKIFFTIEAKILPTPKGTSRKPREVHEYVFGTGAGIQRFKTKHHGLDDSHNILKESGMVAYVKKQDFAYWHNQINDWITKASWPKSEFLSIVSLGSTARLLSEHTRDDNSVLQLHHFWIQV